MLDVARMAGEALGLSNSELMFPLLYRKSCDDEAMGGVRNPDLAHWSRIKISRHRKANRCSPDARSYPETGFGEITPDKSGCKKWFPFSADYEIRRVNGHCGAWLLAADWFKSCCSCRSWRNWSTLDEFKVVLFRALVGAADWLDLGICSSTT